MSRRSLAEALRPAAQAPAPVEHAETTPSEPARPPSRRGRRAITVYTSAEAHRQLRLLAVETDTPIQQLAISALNDLFEKHGKPRIAD